MKRRRAIEPSQLGRRRRRRRLIKFLLWLLLLILIVVGASFLTHWSKISVQNIVVKGNEVTSSSDISSLAESDMTGNYYYLFSRRNILLFPKAQIENDILNHHSRIMSASIKQTALDKIEIDLSERKAIGIWCFDISATTSASCYSIDQTGYLFDKAPEIYGANFFTYSGLVEQIDPIGSRFLPADRFQALNKFIADLRKLNINPASLVATDLYDFQLNLDTGGKILFSTREPLDQALSNLEIVINKNNPDGASIDLSKIDYIDLRFGNKINYKLKSGTAVQSATTSASSTL